MAEFSWQFEKRILASLSGLATRLHKRLNRWFWRTAGGDERPVVFNIDKTVPELREIEKEFSRIRSEFLAASQQAADLPTFHEADPAQRYISATTPHDWRMLYLYVMGDVVTENVAMCPATIAALKRVPNLFQASFSILDAGKSVPEHKGPYYGYLRYHLGIEVPADNPPSIRIRDHVHTWKEGDSLLFDDSWNHEVINNSTERRVVLIVDVLRPMPRTQHLANRFFAFVMRFFYGRMVLRRLKRRASAATAA